MKGRCHNFGRLGRGRRSLLILRNYFRGFCHGFKLRDEGGGGAWCFSPLKGRWKQVMRERDREKKGSERMQRRSKVLNSQKEPRINR